MQICRIEHKETGEGPYHCSLYRIDEMARINGLNENELYNSFTCPAPIHPNEFGFSWAHQPDDKWKYGFADLDQLLAWFPDKWINVFHSLDFHIVIYDMQYYNLTVRKSDHQVAFQPKHATRVGEMALI